MAYYFFPSHKRGSAQYDWLKTYYSFSFASYYNPDNMDFAALRVLNDDTIAGGKGFDTHEHQDMEIITLVLEGKLMHQDTLGSKGVLQSGDVQVMSAGKGIAHSEYNALENEELKLLQIWIEPKSYGITATYEQKFFPDLFQKNGLTLLVSGEKKSDSLSIHQDAQLYMLNLEKYMETSHYLVKLGRAIYFFVIDGELDINTFNLQKRDALGVKVEFETEIELLLSTKKYASVLLIDVPENTK